MIISHVVTQSNLVFGDVEVFDVSETYLADKLWIFKNLFSKCLFVTLFFLKDHCCVLNSIVGWDSTIGKWARVEGTPSDPNPNDPYAKIDSETLFRDGKLTPSITILGKWNLHSSFELLNIHHIQNQNKCFCQNF